MREHIVRTPETCGGQPRIAGSRIRVKDVVVWHIHNGISLDEIVTKWPHLSLAGLHAALAYYYDHKDEVEAEIEADVAWYEEMKAKGPSFVKERLAQLRGRMPRTIRFHLDEDVDPAIASGLRRSGIDVTTSQEVGLLGADDTAQLAFAHPAGRVLFTHDDDHLRPNAQGIEHSGIAYCHQRRRSLAEIIEASRSSGNCSSPSKWPTGWSLSEACLLHGKGVLGQAQTRSRLLLRRLQALPTVRQRRAGKPDLRLRPSPRGTLANGSGWYECDLSLAGASFIRGLRGPRGRARRSGGSRGRRSGMSAACGPGPSDGGS
jgi:uncharacterized protein (DUF433 family)